MADIRYYDVILKPVVTEKSMDIMADKKYTFLVHPEANKAMIKEAVEKMFPGTEVKTVNTMNNDGKTKRRGRTEGKTVKTKKAIVTLTENSKEIEDLQVCNSHKEYTHKSVTINAVKENNHGNQKVYPIYTVQKKYDGSGFH